MSEIIQNIEKIRDGLYKYDIVKTLAFQTDLTVLNKEKADLLKRIANIDFIISEIAKLEVK